MAPGRTLENVHLRLREQHGAPMGPDLKDPFELILWEQVGYLVSDERRRQAFDLLADRVGLDPAEIAGASLTTLTEVAAAGGAIAKDRRAERMHESARRVMTEHNGDLGGVLRLPLADAIRALTRFPMIGEPGAENILMRNGAQPLLALDSNALRVLLRLGYGAEGKNYAQTYANVRAATEDERGTDCGRLISLSALLHRHGREVCRRRRAHCERCRLTALCEYYNADHAARNPGRTPPDAGHK